MTVSDLHRYRGDGDAAVDTLVLLPLEHEKMFRLVADKGKVLTDGEIIASTYDIPATDLDKWYEIDPPEGSDEAIEEPEATTADYLAALNELGVNTDEES